MERPEDRRAGKAGETEDHQVDDDFARGERAVPEPEHEHHGRFSEGIEQLPDDPEKEIEGRFSEGVEELPDDPEKQIKRRFSEGVEQSPTSE